MTMDYISTRGDAPAVGFEQALLKGLAPDGGLYVPRDWPRFSQNELNAFAELDFAAAAARILAPLAAGALSEEQLLEMAQAAFASFDDPAVVAPLFQFGEQDWLMELYHGPTLAFKDVAMQLLGRLFVDVLARRDRRVTIIGATSGDTGAAAIEAFRGQERVDVFILHPAGRVSEVQRRIMTSVEDGNIHNIAIEGSFDDCQRIVKTLLSDKPFAERYALGGVNSINWARLAVQIVYYFTTAASLGRLDLPTSYVVPTGNFGDIFAGYAAKRMGLPVDKLVIAVNENDILHRTLESGVYQSRGVKATNAPSMDIQIASNFERLVYEAGGRDADAVKAFIEASLSQEGATLAPHALEAIRSDFTSARADEDEIRGAIKAFYETQDMLIDPHTAIGVVAMQKARASGALTGPAVTLSTAHPAKFPEAVEGACGRYPDLPPRFGDLYERAERLLTADNSADAIKAVIADKAAI